MENQKCIFSSLHGVEYNKKKVVMKATKNFYILIEKSSFYQPFRDFLIFYRGYFPIIMKLNAPLKLSSHPLNEYYFIYDSIYLLFLFGEWGLLHNPHSAHLHSLTLSRISKLSVGKLVICGFLVKPW